MKLLEEEGEVFVVLSKKEFELIIPHYIEACDDLMENQCIGGTPYGPSVAVETPKKFTVDIDLGHQCKVILSLLNPEK